MWRNMVPPILDVSGEPQLPSESVNELLSKWRAGDQNALSALMPLVYKELHGVAHHYLRKERPDHTLQTTALVHEAYLRLSDQGPFDTENRAHFVAIAARPIRPILVDYCRSRGAAERRAGCAKGFDSRLVLPPKFHA